MPLTKQIIEDVMRKVIRIELTDVKSELTEIRSRLDRVETKVDVLNTSVSNFSGQVQKFDDEQTFITNRQGIHNDRNENLEKKTFGAIQVA